MKKILLFAVFMTIGCADLNNFEDNLSNIMDDFINIEEDLGTIDGLDGILNDINSISKTFLSTEIKKGNSWKYLYKFN